MILQHENMRTNASELGFHGLHIAIFSGGFNLNHQQTLCGLSAARRVLIAYRDFIHFSVRRSASDRPIVRIR